jgi:hypothetical protein
LELFPTSRTRPRTPTNTQATDSLSNQQSSITMLHDLDYLSTQSSLTQEPDFLSDPSFPISAVEAEIDEERETEEYLDIDTIDTSDLEDKYQDFQEFEQAH